MKIEHNSQNEFYRTPFGAVKSGTKIKLRLSIKDGGIPESIKLICSYKEDTVKEYNMAYITELSGSSLYEATVETDLFLGNIWYYFEIKNEKGHIFYGNNTRMLGGIGEIYQSKPKERFQITVYSPEFKTPDWWKKSVCYQIFCDRFYNGNENGEFSGNRQDIIKRQWTDTPFYKASQFGGEYLANDFFGGNLKGIEKKLDFLKELGIDAIYLNPIFKAYSNHKYDTGDYMEIDENFGTEADFESLTKTAKKKGIRIVLDGVFNHTGSNSRYFNKNGEYESLGAYQSKDSEYYDWYTFTQWNNEYDCWWGMKTLPHVNEASKSYQDYILSNNDSVVKHWLKKGASGWRLDVVDELPGFFVKILRREVKKENPDAVIIGEVWEDASNKESYGEKREYFLGKELDSVMNYPLRDALISAVLGRITAPELDERIMSLKENYPPEAFYSLLNMLSTHDTERILTALSGAPDRRSVDKEFQAGYKIDNNILQEVYKKAKQIVTLQMLLPGVPCVYYGDEAGMEGYGDPFCRGTYIWGNENKDILDWYKTVIALRKKFNAYIEGEYETVYKIDRGFGFIRHKGEDKHIVLTNFSNEKISIRLDIARFNIHTLTGELNNESHQSFDGIYYIDLFPGEIKAFLGNE